MFVGLGHWLQGQVGVSSRCGQIVVGQACGFLGGQSDVVDFICSCGFSNNYFISLLLLNTLLFLKLLPLKCLKLGFYIFSCSIILLNLYALIMLSDFTLSFIIHLKV